MLLTALLGIINLVMHVYRFLAKQQSLTLKYLATVQIHVWMLQ